MTLQISRRPNFTKFEHNTSIGVAMNPFGTEFWKFSLKGSFNSFFQKRKKIDFFQRLVTSGRHNYVTIIDQRKFITKWSIYGMSSFHFDRWNQFKSFPWSVHSVQESYPQILCDVDRTWVDAMPHNTDGLSGRGLMTSLWEGKDRLFNIITENWFMNCTSDALYVSNAAMTLATIPSVH